MAMTPDEMQAKKLIIKDLKTHGFYHYARFLDNFHINLTDDPNMVGAMDPINKGVIYLNWGLEVEQMSVIIRHELLHELLQHYERAVEKIKARNGENPDEVREMSIKEIQHEIFKDDTFNMAGDYEISNRGYTEADKKIARAIKLYGQVLQGLVTEDQHPDWVNLSMEEMWEKLQEERKNQPQPEQDKIVGHTIHGTFKNGKFYDANGKEIKPFELR